MNDEEWIGKDLTGNGHGLIQTRSLPEFDNQSRFC